MKRVIAAIVLILAVAGFCVFNVVYIENSYNDLKSDIDGIKESYSSESVEAAQKKAAEFEEKWVKKEDNLSVFVNHDIIDELGVSISKLPIYAPLNEELFLAECKEIEIGLLHMLNDTKINMHSLF